MICRNYINIIIRNRLATGTIVNLLKINNLEQWFLTFLKLRNTFDYVKNVRNTKINDPKNKRKHILENILLSIFKFYILKYIIKILQSRDNNKKKKFAFHNFTEHRLRTSES